MTEHVMDTDNPINHAVEMLEFNRAELQRTKDELINAVQEVQDFLYLKEKGLYVGPDRHNEEWVVTWNSNQSRQAAGQMMLDGQRTCNYRDCECKRPQQSRSNSRF